MLGQVIVVLGFISIHIFANKLRNLASIPRSRWLSFAGGTSVAYVFLHILPELSEARETLREEWQELAVIDHYSYLIGLCGIVIFYGLERVVNASQKNRGDACGERKETPTTGVFWIHIASFSIYNALIGYLLVHREQENFSALILFAIALGFHFLVNDFSLRELHRSSYHNIGRWLLSGAILVGWLIGRTWSVNEVAISTLFAFLAGGIILNVLKEELPEDRKSRFMPFALGAIGYSILIVLAEG